MEKGITPTVGIVIVAGGSGTRMGGATPKQFQILGQQPLLAHTINIFSKALPNADIVVVLSHDRVEYWSNLSARFDVAPHRVVCGGEQRFHSVKSGVEALGDDVEIIGVHDGARPLSTVQLIERCLECAISSGSAIPVIAISDSLREIDDSGSSKIVDRGAMRAVQTPQMFDANTLRRAYNQPYRVEFTDDASLVESIGERVWLCDGEVENIKITTAVDMMLAQYIIEQRDEQE